MPRNLSPVLARVLAASIVLTWPALLVADELPSDGALNGKADDLLTGGIAASLIIGLLAAGWLRPAWVVLTAVAVLGVGVPVVYEALRPTECPAGISGMDCLPVSFAAVYAVPGTIVVLCGSLVRWAVGLPRTDVLLRRRSESK